MPASFRWRVPLCLLVVAFSCWYAFPLSKRISLGLDLQGGMHLILKVDTSKVSPEAKDRDVTGVAVEILRNRIDQFGVREPLIQRQADPAHHGDSDQRDPRDEAGVVRHIP